MERAWILCVVFTLPKVFCTPVEEVGPAGDNGRHVGQSGRALDSIGSGNILRGLQPVQDDDEYVLPSMNAYGRRLDSLGQGNILRQLDSLGQGNILRQLDSLGGGNILRQLDSLGGGNILRQLDSLGKGNILRQLDSLGGGNILRESVSGLPYGKSKKNFDEIDRAGFGRFVKRRTLPVKKNFDEIDNVGFRGFY